MKAFVVLTPETSASWNRGEVYRTVMHGTPVAFALVEQDDVDFPTSDPVHARSVLVRIQAFSCNYREKSRFIHTSRRVGQRGYAIVGSEFAGTVIKVGPGVSDLHAGDRVCGNGSVEAAAGQPGLTTQRASAELQVHDRSKLFRLPESMSIIEGAAFSIGAQTAYSMVSRLSVRAGEHIAVTAAASNTSIFAIKALLARGHTVHALTTSPSIVPYLNRLGVTRVCTLPRDRDPASTLRAYLLEQRITAFDAVIDPFYDVYLRKLLPLLRRFGSYITCGVYRQFAEATPEPFCDYGLPLEEIASLLIRKSITLIGNNLGTTAHLQAAAADHEAKRLNVEIDAVVTNGDIASFIERSYGAAGRIGKVVYAYDPEARGGGRPVPRTAVTPPAYACAVAQ